MQIPIPNVWYNAKYQMIPNTQYLIICPNLISKYIWSTHTNLPKKYMAKPATIQWQKLGAQVVNKILHQPLPVYVGTHSLQLYSCDLNSGVHQPLRWPSLRCHGIWKLIMLLMLSSAFPHLFLVIMSATMMVSMQFQLHSIPVIYIHSKVYRCKLLVSKSFFLVATAKLDRRW